MKRKLQIGIHSNNPDIHMTPVDLVLPGNVADAAALLCAYLDAIDGDEPNGSGDLPLKVDFTIKVFGIKIPIKGMGKIFIKVKTVEDVPSEPGSSPA